MWCVPHVQIIMNMVSSTQCCPGLHQPPPQEYSAAPEKGVPSEERASSRLPDLSVTEGTMLELNSLALIKPLHICSREKP